MGFFDRLVGRKPAPAPQVPADPAPAFVPASSPAPEPAAAALGGGPGGVMPRLAEARKKLAARDLAGAVAIYEEVLASAGDRADVLVTVSGDLGTSGHVVQIIELVAPRYDAARHGPATGINIVQAYLAVRDPNAAQHVLDLLFALDRPELEERLFGFSNAIADLMAMPSAPQATVASTPGQVTEAPKVALVTFSKPIWYYGLEELETSLLPARDGRQRRIAFAQLALPGAYRNLPEALKRPEDELGRFSRGWPLWLAESFQLSTAYQPVAALGLLDNPAEGKSHFIFGAEWTTENLQQLVDNTESGLDYIFTGALRHDAGDFTLSLRLFEVKKFRERKTFSARWTPATADAELAKLHGQVRAFMEWSPGKTGVPASEPASPSAWIDTLAAGASLFLATKGLLPKERLAPVGDVLAQSGRHAAHSEVSSLGYLTLHARAVQLGLAPGAALPPLTGSSLVNEARGKLGL